MDHVVNLLDVEQIRMLVNATGGIEPKTGNRAVHRTKLHDLRLGKIQIMFEICRFLILIFFRCLFVMWPGRVIE